ncbi:hypothetical protein BUALT_Bualt01G0184500 [Buddleja alternifolia]|uniref:Uncharacterized protein n=1 Tax=Buddleja alternifolia TaxID=168488 RepID=A0AAV6YAJ3_9LAMI|nr:hypothetical protein BUALT_Bualt01G0184500 [Buddleja alternifolia]
MKLPKMDLTKKMINQESFTRQRIKKAKEQMQRIQKENKRKALEIFMYKCIAGVASLENFDKRDAPEMSWVINQTLSHINPKMEAMHIAGQHHDADPSTSASPPECGPINWNN